FLEKLCFSLSVSADKTESTLQWHQRQAIAIGIGKGLRFLHEECRGSPIIHRDLRPSNVLLTHDFVPMVGDFGLARWKTIDPVHTRLLGTLGPCRYLAPEYVESGCISVRTDVYAFGVILLQLISGRKVIDAKQLEGQQSIREWAVPLIEELALHKLIDPRLGESYDTYELYQMAKAAYLCVQRNPEKRPSAGQVLSLLEGKDDHMQHFRDHFDPSYSSL
ncbi:Protein kinase STUNTED, partial [Linum perenne]